MNENEITNKLTIQDENKNIKSNTINERGSQTSQSIMLKLP